MTIDLDAEVDAIAAHLHALTDRVVAAVDRLSALPLSNLETVVGFSTFVAALVEAEDAVEALPDGLPAKTQAMAMLAPLREGVDTATAVAALANGGEGREA